MGARPWLVALVLFLPLWPAPCKDRAPGTGPGKNRLLIYEEAGKTTPYYPVQVGRPFAKGEIPEFPEARVNGVPVFTQADVKDRWPDGSVKHAVLSFHVPLLPAHGVVLVTFGNQHTGHQQGALTAQQMLDPAFDFDAVMMLEAPSGSKREVHARDLLAAGAFTYWTQGPLATTIVLADHSPARTFDVGFDEHRSFRPIFHAVFWPLLHRVRVRFIGEVANTEAFQDMTYALELRVGKSAPQTVYTKPVFTHHAASRWTRVAWIGGAPPPVAVDHDFTYLVKTRFFPCYDLTKQVSEAALAAEYQKWLAAPRDLYDPGLWHPAMPDTGGRPEIGPYPTWTVRWLYTFDPRMEEEAFGQADLAAAWPMHFREGAPGKNLLRTDPPGAGTGLGHVLAVTDRKTLCLWNGFDYKYTLPEDTIHPVGPFSNGGWKPDGAHQPDPFTPQYILTGDFWYLEEALFWASWSAAYYNGAATDASYGRGPTGAEGGIHDETRGEAWVLRNRMNAAFLAPQDLPEKEYFTVLANDALAIFEGMRDIHHTAFEGTSAWKWAHEHMKDEFQGLGPPPFHHWDSGSPYLVQDPVDPSKVLTALSPWQEWFMLFTLGRGRELGFPTEALLKWLGRHLSDQVTDPAYDPYLVCAYRMPCRRLSDGNYCSSWAELHDGFLASFNAKAEFEHYLEDPEHGYAFAALAAASMIAGDPEGEATWNWMAAHALDAPVLDDVPKWALLPRKDAASAGHALTCAPDTLPATTGGTVTFTLDAGAGNGKRTYLLLAGLSGIHPGISLPGGMVVLPLNPDLFTLFVMWFAGGGPPLEGFHGLLDLSGHGEARFVCPGLPPGCAGLEIYFAAAVGPPWNFASNPVLVTVTP